MTGVLGNGCVHEHGSVVACCFVRIFPFKADVRVSGLTKKQVEAELASSCTRHQWWADEVWNLWGLPWACCTGSYHVFLPPNFSISIAFALHKWDGCCKSRFWPHKTWLWFCFSSCSKSHLCTLYSLQSSHDLKHITLWPLHSHVSPTIELAVHLILHLHFGSNFSCEYLLETCGFSIENFPSSCRFMHLLNSMDQKSMSDPGSF